MIVDKCILEGAPVKIGPNGIDVSPIEIHRISMDATATVHGATREINPPKQLVHAEGDFYRLTSGIYEVRLAVKIKIPKNAVGKCVPRSTLNRLGMIKAESAVWDSGYEGWGTVTVMVPIKELMIHKDEAWFQFIIEDAYESEEQYNGFYQLETRLKM